MKCLYEIHLTVSNIYDPDRFLELCNLLEIRPLVIHAGVLKLMTTSCSMVSTFNSALHSCLKQKETFEREEFVVDRFKIETLIDNPLWQILDSDQYMETHYEVFCKESELPALDSIANRWGDWRSKNEFKSGVYMLTYRDYNSSRNTFIEKTDARTRVLTRRGFEPKSVIKELVVIDNKPYSEY